MSKIKTKDGYSKKEVKQMLDNGNRFISNRFDELVKKDGKYLIQFYIGNSLSNSYEKFFWKFLNTFELKKN